jgi:hypothetical protein
VIALQPTYSQVPRPTKGRNFGGDNMTEKPPAGWYPDSEGTMRWWDGDGWTETLQSSHIATATMPVPPAEQPHNVRAEAAARKAYAKANRPWYKKKRWIGAIIILVIIVLASLGTGGGDNDPKKVDSSGNTVDTKGDKAGSKGSPVAIGETIELEGTRYTVKSAKTAPTVGGEFFEEKAGGVYVIVELTIENSKDETKTFMSNAAKLMGGNDKKYSTDDDGTIAAIGEDGEPLIFEDMQPDVPKTGVLVYDVPKAAVAGGVLQVSDLYGRGDAYINLALK